MLNVLKRHPVRTVIAILLVAVFVFLLKSLVFWSPDSMDHLLTTQDGSPLVIAHRGASDEAPENTLASFERAIEMGADAIELDVKLSADGEAVIIHDDTVDRTTDGTGTVAEMTLAQLKQLDAGAPFDPKFTGEHIPTLREVIDLVDGRAIIFIELKTVSLTPTDLEGTVIDIVNETDTADKTILISFNPFSLIAAKRKTSEIPLGLLYTDETSAYLRDRWFAPFIHPEALLPRRQMVTLEHVQEMRDRGHPVFVWTVDEPEDMEEIIGMGVEGIITNRPDVALQILGR